MANQCPAAPSEVYWRFGTVSQWTSK